MKNIIEEGFGFTDEQKKILETIENMVTVDMFNTIEEGETIELNEEFSLYRYVADDEDDDFFKVTVFKDNTHEEICDVMIDGQDLVFDIL